MPEITTITSESLQAEVRRLLPSQRGFGTDLEAQNVIVPIVDLTPTAEGSSLRDDLQTAANYGALTTIFRATAGNTVVVNTPGFYKYQFQANVPSSSSADTFGARLQLTRLAAAAKNLVVVNNVPGSSGLNDFEYASGIVFLATGDTLRVQTVGTGTFVAAQAWPIADVNGNFINPDGFSFE
jgi:hypothetical protein